MIGLSTWGKVTPKIRGRGRGNKLGMVWGYISNQSVRVSYGVVKDGVEGDDGGIPQSKTTCW